MAAGSQNAADLSKRCAAVEEGDKVEVLIGEGDYPSPADLEGDAALGIETYAGICLTDHLLGAIDAAHARQRKLTSEEERPLAVPALQLEDPLRPPDVQGGGCERG